MRLHVVMLVCGSLLGRTIAASAAPPVDDSTRNAARNLAEQGRDAFESANFERSRDLFHRAYELVQAPTLALYEARSLVRLGRLVEAEEAYLRATRTPLTSDSPEPFRKAVREAEQEETQLVPRVPKVTIVVSGASAQAPELTVTVDGTRVKSALLGVEMPVDPGEHRLEAQVPGGEVTRVSFSVAERERKTVEVRVAPARGVPAPAVATPPATRLSTPPEPRRSTWQKPAAIAAGGVGLVGLGTGIVAGLLAASKHSDAERQCPNRACVEGTEGAEAVDAFRSLRTVSTVGYVVGAVGVAAGVTLFLTAPSARDSSQASVGLWMGAGSAGVRGAF